MTQTDWKMVFGEISSTLVMAVVVAHPELDDAETETAVREECERIRVASDGKRGEEIYRAAITRAAEIIGLVPAAGRGVA